MYSTLAPGAVFDLVKQRLRGPIKLYVTASSRNNRARIPGHLGKLEQN